MYLSKLRAIYFTGYFCKYCHDPVFECFDSFVGLVCFMMSLLLVCLCFSYFFAYFFFQIPCIYCLGVSMCHQAFSPLLFSVVHSHLLLIFHWAQLSLLKLLVITLFSVSCGFCSCDLLFLLPRQHYFPSSSLSKPWFSMSPRESESLGPTIKPDTQTTFTYCRHLSKTSAF